MEVIVTPFSQETTPAGAADLKKTEIILGMTSCSHKDGAWNLAAWLGYPNGQTVAVSLWHHEKVTLWGR